MVSASSRYFPGLVVIAQPSTPFEVAEALVHEGAHEKFFDLAITRSFFDMNSDTVEEFAPSWSGARWPMEQVFAAWHAYQCLAQFAESGVSGGPDSLLPLARERSSELGSWLRAHEDYLLGDARWMLRKVLDGSVSEPPGITPPNLLSGVRFVANRLVRMGARVPTGRRVVARVGAPPELFWLDADSAMILDLLVTRADEMSFEDGFASIQSVWHVDEAAARERWSYAVAHLLDARLVESTA